MDRCECITHQTHTEKPHAYSFIHILTHRITVYYIHFHIYNTQPISVCSFFTSPTPNPSLLGYVQSSYVVRKFLEPQKMRHLVVYLEKLMEKGRTECERRKRRKKRREEWGGVDMIVLLIIVCFCVKFCFISFASQIFTNISSFLIFLYLISSHIFLPLLGCCFLSHLHYL